MRHDLHNIYTRPMQPVAAPQRRGRRPPQRPTPAPAGYVGGRPGNVVRRPITTYRTVPVPPVPTGRQPALPPRPAAKKRPAASPFRNKWVLLTLVGAPLVLTLCACLGLTLGAVAFLSGGHALPGVGAAGVELGGLSEREAAAALTAAWTTRGILLQDGDRAIPIDPGALGITLDAAATAERAVEYGRAEGNPFRAIFDEVAVAPVVTLDAAQTASALDALLPQIDQPAVNAGVQLVNGVVEPRPAVSGRMLNVAATVAALRDDPAAALADGAVDLVMDDVPPAITDPTPIVEQARALLANPLTIRAYDPIRDETLNWSVAPETWANWVTAATSDSGALQVSLDVSAVRPYLAGRAGELGPDRYINPDEAAAALRAAVEGGQTAPRIRVYHRDRTHVVQPGESVISIAWDYGVPFPWIQAANPGVGDSIRAGQALTIPSADNFLDYPVVYDKRIVVDLSEQRTRVYENGALKWDWPTSTGINDSPTWPGIYQVILHEPNAYASIWNLSMPNFIGVYRPVPGSDFMNGFHGFPTRGTSQLLWTNSLGTRVTYGCILLSNENARALYDWAEKGVVVEIRP